MDLMWSFPRPDPDADDLVAAGADLRPETLVAAYAAGYFPMPLVHSPLDLLRRAGPDAPGFGWYSPRHRGVLRPEALMVSGSLARATRRYHLSVNGAFETVIERCGDPARRGHWITAEIVEAYERLHALGIAHSVEVWDPDDQLVGGVYGVSLGALFAGESMFHSARDASKVALVGLVTLLTEERTADKMLIDTQWQTDHLASLGIEEWDRERYLDGLPALTSTNPPDVARWAAKPTEFTQRTRARATALRSTRR